MTKRDYYEILGVPRNVDDATLKKAYRKLARQYHPDVNKDNNAEEKFKEINEANEVLSDSQKRSRYDQFGHAGVNDGSGFGGFGGADGFSDMGGFGDIFDMFFGGGRSGGGRRNTGPQPGADLRYDMDINFQEAAFGVEKEIEIFKWEDCPKCKATGCEDGTQPTTCPACNGTGEIRQVSKSILGQFVNVHTCSRCSGSGRIIEHPCKNCSGKGKIRNKHKLSVKIPQGVDSGVRLRIDGAGQPGERGGPYGDLYVYIHVMEDPKFKRQEYDIYTEFDMSYAQAALGDEVTIETIDGEHTLNIPAGTQHGTVFRIAGKGVPRLKGSGRGDHHVKVRVIVPTNLTSEEKELLEQFAILRGDKKDKIPGTKDKGFFDKFFGGN